MTSLNHSSLPYLCNSSPVIIEFKVIPVKRSFKLISIIYISRVISNESFPVALIKVEPLLPRPHVTKNVQNIITRSPSSITATVFIVMAEGWSIFKLGYSNRISLSRYVLESWNLTIITQNSCFISSCFVYSMQRTKLLIRFEL